MSALGMERLWRQIRAVVVGSKLLDVESSIGWGSRALRALINGQSTTNDIKLRNDGSMSYLQGGKKKVKYELFVVLAGIGQSWQHITIFQG